MASVAETLFYHRGIDPILFGQYLIHIGDEQWWSAVGIVPTSIAEIDHGAVQLRATRLIVLATGMLRAWGVTDADALKLLRAEPPFEVSEFATIVDAAKRVFFIGTYEAIVFQRAPLSPNAWLRRQNQHFSNQTPLQHMLLYGNGIDEVLGYLEDAGMPVTYEAADRMTNQEIRFEE